MILKLGLDKSTLAGMAAIILWSTTVALARSISEQVGPLTTIAAVYTIGGLLLLIKEFSLKERSFRDLQISPPRHFFICGSLFLIYTISLFMGLGLASDRLQTLEIGLINYLWTALTILFSIVFFQISFRWFLGPATLLAIAGIALVVTQGTKISLNSFFANLLDNPTAYALGMMAALTWGLYSNLTRFLAGARQENSVPFFILITGVVLMLIRFAVRETSAIHPAVVIEILFLGVSTALAYVFWDLAMRKGNATLVATCAYLTPLLSTIVSCLYLRMLPGLQLWIGCLLIIAGSFLSWRSLSKRG